MEIITQKQAANNMLTNAKNSVTIYDVQIAYYEEVAELQTDELMKANWLVERDKIKAHKKSMEDTLSTMEPFVAKYN